MIDTFLKLFQLLTPRQKRDFYLLQLAMLLSSAAELLGTVSIMPFMALAASPNIVVENVYFSQVNTLLGAPSHERLLFYVGGGFIFFVVVANALMLITQFLMGRYSFRLGGEISTRLYGFYLSKDIIFHSKTNSATLTQRVMRDAQVLSDSLLTPALRLNSRIFSILLLTGLLIYVDPMVAVSTLVVLGSVYWFIYYVVRGAIHRNGAKVSELGQTRNRMLNESFGGIKDMKLYSFETTYRNNYEAATKASDRALANNQFLGEFPYYLVETIVFAGMVLLTLYLYSSAGSLTGVLPVLTLYGMAGMKIVPKVQQSYLAITRIRNAQPAFHKIYPDLSTSNDKGFFADAAYEPLSPRHSIELRGVTFSFGEELSRIFQNYSVNFKVGEISVLVGASGAGKSTLLHILMGLIKPDEGCIAIDGEILHEESLQDWRASIGYVPQDVYLVDGTVEENIAFGVVKADIDIERVKRAARMAAMHDFIENLPDGYQASVGEKGGKFSGGQKQRIGLARAFYREVSVLLLDEATSALDMQTQSEILENLKASGYGLTVIMATHRSEAIAVADRVIGINDNSLHPQ